MSDCKAGDRLLNHAMDFSLENIFHYSSELRPLNQDDALYLLETKNAKKLKERVTEWQNLGQT